MNFINEIQADINAFNSKFKNTRIVEIEDNGVTYARVELKIKEDKWLPLMYFNKDDALFALFGMEEFLDSNEFEEVRQIIIKHKKEKQR